MVDTSGLLREKEISKFFACNIISVEKTGFVGDNISNRQTETEKTRYVKK